MTNQGVSFHLPPRGQISTAVDIEELLAERGVTVDHVTIYRWVQRCTPEFVEAARTCRHVPSDRWFVDETYVKVNGRWTYLYRAVDQFGQVIDVWLSVRRDLTAARVFFARALAAGAVPIEVTTDRAPTYPRVLDELVPAFCTAQSDTRTTESKPTMADSKQGSDPCAASRPSDQLASSLRVMPSSRTCDAAITTSPPMSQPTTDCRLPSMNSRSPSDRRQKAAQPSRSNRQRNRALGLPRP